MSRGYLKYPVAVKGSSTAVRDYYWSEIWSVGYQEHLLGQGMKPSRGMTSLM